MLGAEKKQNQEKIVQTIINYAQLALCITKC